MLSEESKKPPLNIFNHFSIFRNTNTMPITSRWTAPVPETSLPTWVFGSHDVPLPDRKTFIDASDPTRFQSFADYRHFSKRIAVGLQKAGIRPGDRVLLFSGNDMLVPCLFMGVVMTGAIFTGASPAFTARELSYQLQDSGTSLIIAADQVLDVAVEASRAAGLSSDHIYAFDRSMAPDTSFGKHTVKHWTELLGDDSTAAAFRWFEPQNTRETTCCLNYSSGTTGRPKGVEITHYAYVANGEAGLHRQSLVRELWGGPYDGRMLCMLPLYHAAAQTTFCVNCPKAGMDVYIMPVFEFTQMLQHIQDFKITDLTVAPPIVLGLAKHPLCRKMDLSSVRSITSGTAPLALHVAHEASELWKDDRVLIREAWGMTELTCMGIMVDPRSMTMTGAVGEPALNSAIKLMDGNVEITEPEKRGELWFTSPTLMKGYWRNPEATKETLVVQDGVTWLRTGDVAYVDNYGPGCNLHIVDRIKELIKVKGFQVAPAELEAVLLTRPDVADAAVIGVHKDGIEAPRAYIVRSPGTNASEEEICKWLEEHVAPYKRLTGGVVFTDAIPKVPVSRYLPSLLPCS